MSAVSVDDIKDALTRDARRRMATSVSGHRIAENEVRIRISRGFFGGDHYTWMPVEQMLADVEAGSAQLMDSFYDYKLWVYGPDQRRYDVDVMGLHR